MPNLSLAERLRSEFAKALKCGQIDRTLLFPDIKEYLTIPLQTLTR